MSANDIYIIQYYSRKWSHLHATDSSGNCYQVFDSRNSFEINGGIFGGTSSRTNINSARVIGVAYHVTRAVLKGTYCEIPSNYDDVRKNTFNQFLM